MDNSLPEDFLEEEPQMVYLTEDQQIEQTSELTMNFLHDLASDLVLLTVKTLEDFNRLDVYYINSVLLMALIMNNKQLLEDGLLNKSEFVVTMNELATEILSASSSMIEDEEFDEEELKEETDYDED